MELEKRKLLNREIVLCIKNQYPRLYREAHNVDPLEFGMRLWLFCGGLFYDD